MKFVSALLIALIFLGSLASGSAYTSTGGDIKSARKYAEENLLPQEGIVGVSHTEKPPKIIVYIENERYRSKVPSNIMGFEVEVVVTGRIQALSLLEEPLYTYSGAVSRTSRVRPLSGGISIGVPEASFGGKMAGTLGVVVQGPNGNYYILSCAHVLAMDSKAKFLPMGTPTLQPGTYDGGTDADKVGELYSYIKITFGPKGKNYADAAISLLTTTEYLPYEILGNDNQDTYKISGTTDVSVGDVVRKSGRTTGVTENIVTDASASVKVWYAPGKFAIFYDQILVQQPFLDSGDSGSLVDKGGAFVGLGFAGSSSVAVVCKAKYIVQGLGISV
ncbi:MAG: hypothetical protein ACP5KW_10380 [Thermoproteota archaeon]